LIKVLKDLDFIPDSNKNLSKILPSSGLSPGPDEVGQKGLKQLHIWRLSQKNWKTFYSLQTQRLAQSFEGLNSSLAQLSVEIFCAETCANYWILASKHANC